jgi:predicted metal-dependent enzyme (double-stranded beta helix superfamily)
MAYTLESFAADCRKALQSDSGPAGRDKVRECLERALRDDAFLETCLGPNAGDERAILYEDPELEFCICAHVYNGPKQGHPHDHGPTWAIYGQAAGETEMTDWRMISPPADGQPGKVKKVRTYRLKPGDAHVYEVGDVHAPYRAAPTKLIRIEGKNTDKLERTPIEAVT